MLVNAKRLQRKTIWEAQQVKIRGFVFFFFLPFKVAEFLHHRKYDTFDRAGENVNSKCAVWSQWMDGDRISDSVHISHSMLLPSLFIWASLRVFFCSLLPGKAYKVERKCIGLLFPITQTHINLILLLAHTQHYPKHGWLDGRVCVCVSEI